MPQILRAHAIGMLTAGMSTRAVTRELNVHLSTVSHLQRRSREFGSTSNRPHNRRLCVTTPASTSSIFTSNIVWDQPPEQLLQQSVCLTKSFLHKLSETVPGKLICMLTVLIVVSTWLQLVIVTDLSGQNAYIRWCLALWRGVLLMDESWFSLYMADGRQHVWHRMGERFSDANVVDWVAHGCAGVMVWEGICYGQRTQVHFIDGILNAQRYRDEILSCPLLCRSSTTITSCCRMIMQSPMLQGSVHHSWKPKSFQFLHGQHTHRTYHPLSMFRMLWIGVYDSVF